MTIHSLGTDAGLWSGEIGEVTLLGHEWPLQWSRTADGLTVTMPAQKPGEFAFALKITRAA